MDSIAERSLSCVLSILQCGLYMDDLYSMPSPALASLVAPFVPTLFDEEHVFQL